MRRPAPPGRSSAATIRRACTSKAASSRTGAWPRPKSKKSSTTGGLLTNDTDANNDPLTAVLVPASGPAHGTLTLLPTGAFHYVPDANFHGTDQYSYKANDAALDSSPAVVTINVTSVNDAPVATNDDYATAEDTPLVVTNPGILSNDSDVDGDALTP